MHVVMVSVGVPTASIERIAGYRSMPRVIDAVSDWTHGDAESAEFATCGVKKIVGHVVHLGLQV